jgi:nucleotide-binding universal stress UspA family protein
MARIILLHVVASGSAITVDSSGLPAYNPAVIMDFATKALAPWCYAASKKGILCDSLVREGNIAEQIASATRQFRADRIILGTRSKGKLEKLLLGSVAEQVLRSVNLPVMTVGPEAHLPVASQQAANESRQPVVLHATSLRETSRPSAVLACQIAASQGAKLLLLHVLPPVDEMERAKQPTGMESAAMQELRLLAAEIDGQCCTAIHPYVVHGNPSIEILAEAVERQASLIVLGATRRTAFGNLTRDRVVYRVLAHAPCPVLTLREPNSEPADSRTEETAIHL